MAKEIVVTRADVDGNPSNSAWIVIRENDPLFARLAAAKPDQVRDVANEQLYEGCTSYDFDGPVD